MGLKRKMLWLRKEDTQLAKLLLRHAPEHIFDRAKLGLKVLRGATAKTREKTRWVHDFLERKAEYRLKGSTQPATDAYWEMYREDHPNDPRGDFFKNWRAARKKWCAEVRKSTRDKRE